jgi:hypothetical protein
MVKTGFSNTILRTKQLIPDQCLSCGNIEQSTLKAEGLKGVLYKTGERTHSRSGSPNKIEIFTPGMQRTRGDTREVIDPTNTTSTFRSANR